MSKFVRVFHFNDVYEVEPSQSEGGGAAKFASVVERLRREAGACGSEGVF